MDRAFQSLEEYGMTSYNLPDDHSLISPIAKVILQKRRLLKIQEIHNYLLAAELTDSEIAHKKFLSLFKSTFSKVHWNELSVTEAQNLSALIVDAFKLCHADYQVINSILKTALAEIHAPSFHSRFMALRSSLILIQHLFLEFHKQISSWTMDILKSILNILKDSTPNSESHFDCILEGLSCLRIILKSSGRSIDKKELEKIHSIALKYIKAKSVFISYQASSILEIYYDTLVTSISKKDVKIILELLNSPLSSRLYENSIQSSHLLKFCFQFNSESGPVRSSQLCDNIDRIRSYPYIDTRLFSDSMANALLDRDQTDINTSLLYILPRKRSKSFVSPSCFSQIVRLYIERLPTSSESIKAIRFIFETILVSDDIRCCPLEYSIELIQAITDLYQKFPESLSDSDFSAFCPLSIPHDILQLKSVRLIATVIKDRPLVLSTQIILIFAQLKGDFLRLKMKEKDVMKHAVSGLMKLFASVLSVSLKNYFNYCDAEIIEKIREWVVDQLRLNEDNYWIKDEPVIIRGLLLISASLARKDDDLEVTMKVIELMNDSNFKQVECLDTFLEYLIHIVGNNLELYSLFFGSFEKCFLELNSHPVLRNICVQKLSPIMKLISENSRAEFLTIAAVCYFSKIMAFNKFPTDINYCFESEFDLLCAASTNQATFCQVAEYFAKMFWKSTSGVQYYCLTLWTTGIKNKTIVVPLRIIQAVRSLLDCPDIQFENETHRDIIIDHIQTLSKEFLSSDTPFELRVECGLLLGSIVNLLNLTDNSASVELFQQFMKHSMKSDTSKDQSSRVSYIMGLVSLKASLETKQSKYIDVTSNALLGLLSSWNRESFISSKSSKRQIEAATIQALSFYIEQCGCLVNSEFYRDSCELLLEQVFSKDRHDLIVKSVRSLAKTLSLYVNLLPCQSEFISKTIKVITESKYLFSFDRNSNISLLLEISELNPQVSFPSEIILTDLKCNIYQYNLGSVCQYLSHHLSLSLELSYRIIDFGLLSVIFSSFNCSDMCSESDFKSLNDFLQQIFDITLIYRYDYWMESVLEPIASNSSTQSVTNETSGFEMSDSVFSATELSSDVTIKLTAKTVHLLLKCINQSLHKLIDLSTLEIKRFIPFAIKLCFSISVEKPGQREFFLSGIYLLRGLVRTFSVINDEQTGRSILEPFDSQIVSIISSTLRSAENFDPFFAACAFGTLFSLLLNREDLREELKIGSGRIVNIIKSGAELLLHNEIHWSNERIDNLVLLSILVGVSSLKKIDFDLDMCLECQLSEVIKLNLNTMLASFGAGKLEKNILLALSGHDRLLLASNWIALVNTKISSPDVLNGMLIFLLSLNSVYMEQVCTLSINVLTLEFEESCIDADILRQFLQKIVAFGLETKDPLCVEVLDQTLKSTQILHDVPVYFLCILGKEFLSKRFGDFDSSFGLAILNAHIDSNRPMESKLVFSILNKLIEVCFNDLEVNNSKDMLKVVKRIFTSDLSGLDDSFKSEANNLLVSWISRLIDVDSVFLNQLVFFCISTCPEIWTTETYNSLRKHFDSMIKNLNTIEGALDSWVLLLKARSKGNDSEIFVKCLDYFTDQVKVSFVKYRGAGIDPIWERIFGIAESICKSSGSNDLLELKAFCQNGIENLNDFK